MEESPRRAKLASLAPKVLSSVAIFSKSLPGRITAMARSLSMRQSWITTVPMALFACAAPAVERTTEDQFKRTRHARNAKEDPDAIDPPARLLLEDELGREKRNAPR